MLVGTTFVTCILFAIPRVAVDRASEQLDQYTNFWHLQISRYVKADEKSTSRGHSKSSSSVVSSSSSRDSPDEQNDDESLQHKWTEPELPVNGMHLLRWFLFSLTLLATVAVAVLLFALVVERAIQRPKLAEMIRSARIYSSGPEQAATSSK